ncbi:hypothetical protein CALVIDRAFT_567784 [Calocera viscosa TUFC12733]|uniref:Uncharacterized protein n=1 Tax=Calocera viscosa (strain TUFC12733) TaxID=1330018 RepID=A0A167HR26_CALVF|nr:hypothetical protein CALVIDRAFT_567784 [Calocera viscosa TUFC12733]
MISKRKASSDQDPSKRLRTGMIGAALAFRSSEGAQSPVLDVGPTSSDSLPAAGAMPSMAGKAPSLSIIAGNVQLRQTGTPADDPFLISADEFLTNPVATPAIGVGRLLGMRKECDAHRGTYYITRVPNNLDFGRMDSFLDMRNFLVGRRNSAIRVFVSGILMSTDFKNADGMPLRHVSVVVKPLTTLDSMAASRIYNDYSMPVERTTKDSFLNIQASRWQTSYGAPRESPGNAFTHVYLAQRSIQDREQYSSDSLSRGDLVVLEMRVRCRRGENRGRWVEFQLQAINVLLPGAKDVESPQPGVLDQVDW